MLVPAAITARNPTETVTQPQKLSNRAQWLKARAARDFATSETLARGFLKKRPDDLAAARGLARDLVETGRAEKALEVWRSIFEQVPEDIEASYHLWCANPRDPRLASLGAGQIAILERARRFRLSEGESRPIHHVAICGISYCGSTLFDRMLGGLPGVASIGESHWLIKRRHERSFTTLSFEHYVDEEKLVPCSVCGDGCEVLSRDFRLGLAADHTDWYQRIGARLGALHLISADKNLVKLVENDPKLRFDALVMFKSPDQAWRSKLNKLPEGESADFYRAELDKFIQTWLGSYRHFLFDLKPTGKTIFLNFDAFAENPAPYAEAVCRKLGLPYSPEILTRTIPGHAVGGNRGSMANLRELDYSVKIRPLAPADLPQRQHAFIEGNELVQDTYRELMARHDMLLAGD
ncbi:hypothetical protein C7449_107184 [Mycoplana dimorpha]|uniref:Sulfotransferase family protein n=2 Tax=Mycoplana dimorpha TaxID=28320 RepID=A0A2T5B1C5_MYCDI|nr:hypothetical protein C7449_107184 [Mycoplana dimorpha]